MPEAILDYSNYFWQGDKVRLCALTTDDAAHRLSGSLDSISKVVHYSSFHL